MRFVATSSHITFARGAYLRVVPAWAVGRPRRPHLPEHERPSDRVAELGPELVTGAELVLDGKPLPVLWADSTRAVVEVAGRTWLISHMTPAEMATFRQAFDPGSLVQEWIVREEVNLSAIATA